jgi:low temperature requirement protein LtrA
VLQGLLVLALLWWTWSAYAWLGNQARADTGVVRAAMAVAMAALFVVALTVPEAWHDAEGGLYGPLVLVGAYLVVRCLHLSVYTLAARGDPGLRRQLAISWVPTLAGAALLIAGALLGGGLQIFFFAGALAVDWGGVYLTSREGNWRIHSTPHWTERHGLFIILSIGESVVAIGVGAAGQPISTPLLAAGVLGIATALCLWWLYFDVLSRAAEHRLRDARGQVRVRMAIEAYTYGHFPIVAGIIVGAVGVEGVLAHAGDVKPLGLFYATCGGLLATARRAGGPGAPARNPDRCRDEALRRARPRGPPRLRRTGPHAPGGRVAALELSPRRLTSGTLPSFPILTLLRSARMFPGPERFEDEPGFGLIPNFVGGCGTRN